MKWILIILNLGYSYSSTGTTTIACTTNIPNCTTGAPVTTVPSNKQESEPMDRDSCFKAAETVKRAYPQASISCEIRN